MQNSDFISTHQTQWLPPPNVVQLNGDPMDLSMDFFAAPPPCIGPILSATSSLRKGKRPSALLLRLMILLGCIFVGACLMATALAPYPSMGWATGAIVGAMLGGSPGIVICFMLRFRHFVGFVGEAGVARFVCSGRRDRIVSTEVLEFDEADDLFTKGTIYHKDGQYKNTLYDFRWCRSDGAVLLHLAGSHSSERNTPKPQHEYHLAIAAEDVWTQRIVAAMQREFNEAGSTLFRLHRHDAVELGNRWMELSFAGETTRLTTDDVRTIRIHNGGIEIHTNEARWFNGRGKYFFQYHQMANAKAFVVCLQRLAGFEVHV